MNRFSVFGISRRLVYENPELEYFNSCRNCNLDFDVLDEGGDVGSNPSNISIQIHLSGQLNCFH